MQCPCGSTMLYADCCSVFISGTKEAPTPEALMRSRFTAYTLADINYIMRTMRSPAADHFDAVEARAWAQKIKWIKLDVIQTSTTSTSGCVEFIAHYEENGRRQSLHELSKFKNIDGKWFYTDGSTPKAPTVTREKVTGRNEPCHCGSSKKFKKCCG